MRSRLVADAFLCPCLGQLARGLDVVQYTNQQDFSLVAFPIRVEKCQLAVFDWSECVALMFKSF